jgi:hypothetical protein
MVFYPIGEPGSMHNGPRHAGNKSALSFRTGHAVSGYTGYCPSQEAIPIPTKAGPNEAPPEPLRDSRTAQPVLELDMRVTSGFLGETEYRQRFNETSKAAEEERARTATAQSEAQKEHYVTAGHHSASLQQSTSFQLSDMPVDKPFLAKSTAQTSWTGTNSQKYAV